MRPGEKISKTKKRIFAQSFFHPFFSPLKPKQQNGGEKGREKKRREEFFERKPWASFFLGFFFLP